MDIDFLELIKDLDTRSYVSPKSKLSPREFIDNMANPIITKVQAICPIKQDENSPVLDWDGIEVPDDKNIWMVIKFEMIDRKSPRIAVMNRGITRADRRYKEAKRAKLIVYNCNTYFNVGITKPTRDGRVKIHMTDHGIMLSMTDKRLLDEAIERI